MLVSEARLAANRQNATKSTGPKTEEGKLRSRANALKHGLTGAGVVLPAIDEAEVERRSTAFAEELDVTGEIGLALARRAALNSVRMERGADQQAAATARHVREVDAAFVAPEGADPAEAAELRLEACREAMFDPSPRATLIRKYEAAAERMFLRILRELQKRQKAARDEARDEAQLIGDNRVASFYQVAQKFRAMDDEFDKMCAAQGMPLPDWASEIAQSSPFDSRIDLTVGVPPGR
jgi:hypothetical protein